MERFIRETPLLFGGDAQRFEGRMKVKRHEDFERLKRRLYIYSKLIRTF